VTVTVRPCAVVMLAGDGVTITVGAVATAVTVSVFVPAALL
jgi:predicted Na+-dependent transporter